MSSLHGMDYTLNKSEQKRLSNFVQVILRLKRYVSDIEYRNLVTGILEKVDERHSFDFSLLDAKKEKHPENPKLERLYSRAVKCKTKLLSLSKDYLDKRFLPEKLRAIDLELCAVARYGIASREFLLEISEAIMATSWYRFAVTKEEVMQEIYNFTKQGRFSLGLFGSFSREQNTHLSDVDILFWIGGKSGVSLMPLKTYIRDMLEQKIGRPVSFNSAHLFRSGGVLSRVEEDIQVFSSGGVCLVDFKKHFLTSEGTHV